MKYEAEENVYSLNVSPNILQNKGIEYLKFSVVLLFFSTKELLWVSFGNNVQRGINLSLKYSQRFGEGWGGRQYESAFG